MSHCRVSLPTSLAVHGTGFTMTGSPQDLAATSAGGLGRAEQQVGLGIEVGDLVAGPCLVACGGATGKAPGDHDGGGGLCGVLLGDGEYSSRGGIISGLLCGFVVSEFSQPFAKHGPVVGVWLLSHSGLHLLLPLDGSGRSEGGQLDLDTTERIEMIFSSRLRVSPGGEG